MVHLGEEIAGVIKMHAAPARQPASSATILTAHKIPLDQTLVRVLKLLAVSGLASFFVCVCLTSSLAFCNYHAGNSLQCLQSPASTSLRTLTRVLTNPVYFPLTTSTVIPVILLIASNKTLFEKSESRGVSRKAGWYLFISLYSIFLLELTLFIRSDVHSDDAALVLPDPLHWTRPGGGILRNMATYIVFSFLL